MVVKHIFCNFIQTGSLNALLNMFQVIVKYLPGHTYFYSVTVCRILKATNIFSSLFLGAPTNFGLSQKLQQKWSDQVASETYGDYNTTYNSSYEQLPSRLYSATRFATPREKSTTLHKYNHTNRNLNLRNVSMSTAPEDLTNIAGSGAMSSIAC